MKTENFFERYLLLYGFLPMLNAMALLESEEKYEYCALILKVLNKYSDKYGFNIPKTYNKDAIEEMKYLFWKHHNLSGNVTEKNTPWYAAKIITKIERELDKSLSNFNKNLIKCLKITP